MNDKKMFLDMLARADFYSREVREENVDGKTYVYADGCVKHERSGYTGFYALLKFDEDGKLIAIGGIEE